jgi:hypothetical protein
MRPMHAQHTRGRHFEYSHFPGGDMAAEIGESCGLHAGLGGIRIISSPSDTAVM